MKVPLAILVLFGCSVGVFALPASTSSDPRKDVELLPQPVFGDQPIIDTGLSWNSPFGSLFDNIESIMTRMRQQMESVFNRIPSIYGGPNATDFSFSTNLPDNVDPSKVNKTSVTKVIDGHKVVINDTEYKNSNENGGAFFHIRVVDVKPVIEKNSTIETTSVEEPTNKSTTLEKDRESIENSIENEIQKGSESESPKQKRYTNLETFDDVDYIEPIGNEIDNNIEVISPRWDNNQQQQPRSRSFNNYFQRYPQPWFSFGTPYSGEIVAQRETYRRPSGFQNDIRAPFFPQMSYPAYRYPQSQNRFSSFVFPQNGMQQVSYPQNGIRYPQNGVPQGSYPQPSYTQNRFPQVNYPERFTQTATPPFDLSRDTYVNDILAQSGAPTNPDAEIIDVNSLPGQTANRFRYPR